MSDRTQLAAGARIRPAPARERRAAGGAPRARAVVPWLAAAALAVASLPAPAQVVRGRVAEEGGGMAVAAAMMSLVDPSGAPAARTLTRRSGFFELAAPGPGRYRLRADRIGYATTFSDDFTLAAGDTLAMDLDVTVEAIELAGITAEADRNCRMRPEEGLAVSKVWDEARKALAAAAWTQERGIYRYEMQRVRMELDVTGRRVLSEKREYDDEYRRAPFVSLPAEELVDKGFASLSAEKSVYMAPDAGVLLSDAFLDTHCLRLAGRHESGWLGVGFEPGPGRRLPDIAGTLWLDAETARLQRLEFGYRNLNLPSGFADADPGGSVDFREMPNGTWIVESWRIRMPKPTERTDPLGRRVPALGGITVQGGDVLRVHGTEDELVAEASEEGGRIAGIVFDSLRRGLPGALVFVAGANYAVTTDRHGRFEIKHLLPGLYSVNFSVPYFERLAYRPEPLELDVRPDAGTPAQANFSAPSLERIADAVCLEAGRSARDAGRRPQDFQGVLAGQVTDAEGRAVPDAAVVVAASAWEQLRERRTATFVRTNAAGRYVACRLPQEASLELRALPPGALPPDEDAAREALGELVRGRASAGERRTVVIPADARVMFADLRIGPPAGAT